MVFDCQAVCPKEPIRNTKRRKLPQKQILRRHSEAGQETQHFRQVQVPDEELSQGDLAREASRVLDYEVR